MLDTFVSLADPTRLRIVEALAGGERPVGALCTALALPQPLVSKHLGTLRRAALVTVRAAGQQRLYALDPAPFRAMEAWLGELRATWAERNAAIDALLIELQSKESP